MNYYLASRKIYKCKGCYKQFSVTQGTIFERSKIPLTKWFRGMYLFTTIKRGISSCQLAKLLGVRQKTAWFLLQRLRETLKNENDVVLKGIVAADETFIGPKIHRDLRLRFARQKHEKEQDRIHGKSRKTRNKMGDIKKRGRKKGSTKEVLQQKALERGGKPYVSQLPSSRVPFEKHTVVLGMMEKNGRIVMKVLGYSKQSINQRNVTPHLQKHISNDSTLITDESYAYTNAKKYFAKHKTVNHKKAYVIKGVHINNIENAWKHLKKTIDGTYFHVSRQHFERYLNENTYRWNKRDQSEITAFEDFTELLIGKKITYRKLVEKSKNKIAA